MTNSRLCTQMLSMRINFPFIHCFRSSKKWGWCSQKPTVFACVCILSNIAPAIVFFFFFFLRAAALRRSFWVDVEMLNTTPIAEVSHYTKWSESQRSVSQNRKDKPQKEKEADQFLFSCEQKCWTFWTSRIKRPQ